MRSISTADHNPIEDALERLADLSVSLMLGFGLLMLLLWVGSHWAADDRAPDAIVGRRELRDAVRDDARGRQKGGSAIRIALATHDVALIERIAAHAADSGLPKTAFEVQMLYGIRTDQQRRLAREGFIVRDLICYGAAWYPWYMRRLAERPANVLFALRQLLP